MRRRRNSIGTQTSYVHFNSQLGVHTWKENDDFSESRVEKEILCMGTDINFHPHIATYDTGRGEKVHYFQSVWVWRKPVNIACDTDNLSLLKLVCGYGAKMSNLPHSEDPIFVAIFQKNVDIVRHLLISGVDINVYNRDQRSPLYEACWMVDSLGYPNDDGDERSYEIVSLLLDYGANVNEIVARNRALWRYMLCCGNMRLTEMFMKKGMDCATTDEEGCTVIDIFIRGYLLRKGCNGHSYSKHQLLSLFRRLKEMGAPISESEMAFKANVVTSDRENNLCRICLENKEMRIALPCCHHFCRDCISRLARCAICRSKIVRV